MHRSVVVSTYDGHCCRTVRRKQASSHDPTDAARTFRVGLTGTGRSKKSGQLSTLFCVQPKHHTVNVCDVRGRPLVILNCLLMAPAGCCSVTTCCLCVYANMNRMRARMTAHRSQHTSDVVAYIGRAHECVLPCRDRSQLNVFLIN